MKKNVITLLLSVVLAAGSIGSVPVLAAETAVQHEVSGTTKEMKEAAAEMFSVYAEQSTGQRLYTSEQIFNACLYYCLSRTDWWYSLRAEITDGFEEDDLYGDEGGRIVVKIYESYEPVVFPFDCYTIDTRTWKGTDFFGEEIDLNDALKTIYCDADLQDLMTAAGCIFSSCYEGLPDDLVIKDQFLSDEEMESYALQVFYRIGVGIPYSELETTDDYYFVVDSKKVQDLFRNTLGKDYETYLAAVGSTGKYADYPIVKAERNRYKFIQLSMTEPLYYFRPYTDVMNSAGTERVVTAELIRIGDTLGQSRGMYEVRLSRDPESDYGWCLSRITAAEPEFKISSISASSVKTGYPEKNLLDSDITTAWVEDEEGYGEGSIITLKADQPAKVHGVSFASGFLKSLSLYEKNGCPVKYTVIIDGITQISGETEWSFAVTPVHLEDPYSIEEKVSSAGDGEYLFTDSISFGREFTASEISIRIDEVRTGTLYEDTCISEITVY